MVTRTAAQERQLVKAEYNAFLAECPSHELLGRVSNKWVALVLSALGSGPECTGSPRPMRYSQLAKALAGVSPKMLTQTLRSLERDGLVTRTAIATVPMTVSYELTELGLSLHLTVRQLKVWAQEHMNEIFDHRVQFDQNL